MARAANWLEFLLLELYLYDKLLYGNNMNCLRPGLASRINLKNFLE